MIHIDPSALPLLSVGAGMITVMKPLPKGAVLTPKVALAYANQLIEAAAAAEGERLTLEGGMKRSA